MESRRGMCLPSLCEWSGGLPESSLELRTFLRLSGHDIVHDVLEHEVVLVDPDIVLLGFRDEDDLITGPRIKPAAEQADVLQVADARLSEPVVRFLAGDVRFRMGQERVDEEIVHIWFISLVAMLRNYPHLIFNEFRVVLIGTLLGILRVVIHFGSSST